MNNVKKELFNRLVNLSLDINKRILKSGVDFEDSFVGNRNREIIEIQLHTDEKAIMVLGINPSINISKGEDRYPNINFLKSINYNKEDIKSKKEYQICKKYTNTYHQQRYDYLCKGYSMMWEKTKYLEKYLDIYTNINDEMYKIQDKEKLMEYLNRQRTNSKNYVLFTDLLHLKVTNAKKMEVFLGEKIEFDKEVNNCGNKGELGEKEYYKLQDDIFELFLYQLEYYTPQLIWINSKSIKVFLEKYFTKEGIDVNCIYVRDGKNEKIWRCVYKGKIIYFSVFFSNGAMTRQEKKFMKERIDEDLKGMGMLP